MVIASYKELSEAKAKVSELEAAWSKELGARLASLPSDFGFDSLESFVKAVREAAGKRRGRKKGAASRASAKAPAKTGGKKGRRKRATITAETKDSVKKMVADGKTGAAIAKELGISLPSVQNIKKALGLVKSRS